MQPEGTLAPSFGSILGTSPGAGMALLYVFTSIGLLVIGCSGWAVRSLRNVENTVPDHDLVM